LLQAALATDSLGQEPYPRPNEAEAKIEAALGETAKLDFADQPLAYVVETLAKQHKIPIQVDNKALTNEGIGTDTPVTAHIEGVSLRSALRLVLDQLDLTYVVRNEVLFITTRTEAENILIFKVYPVGDLVRGENEFQSPPALEAFAGEDYQSLIGLITCCVAPTSWEGSGPANIHEFRHSHALAFSQSADVHEEVAALLAALRQARHKQRLAAKLLAKAAEKPQPAEVESMHVKVYRLDLPAATPGRTGGGMGGTGGMGGGGFFAVPNEPAAGDKLDGDKVNGDGAAGNDKAMDDKPAGDKAPHKRA